jgi:hypothetical protein
MSRSSTDNIKGSAPNVLMWRHDIQHNDTQRKTLNITIIKGDAKHKRDWHSVQSYVMVSSIMLSVTYADCRE